jgi:hypothetical protein
MRFRVAIALLVVLIVLLILQGNVSAFEPPNVRHHPGFPQNMPMTVKVGQTATMTWEAVDNYGWSGWRDVVRRSLNTDSDDPQSAGRVLNDFLRSEGRGQITIREARAGETPDLKHFAVNTAFLEAKCGTWATACIYGGVPLPVPAYYKAASMITWGYASQAPVVIHETCHTLCRACDQYVGGCPKASDGTWAPAVICTGNKDSVMDCGGAAKTIQQFDYDTFRLAYPANTPFLQQTPITYPFWDGDEWVFESGWKYSPSTPSPYYGTPGNWVHTNGTQEFAFVMVVEGGEQWFNYRENAYHMKGSTFWRHVGGSEWDCLSFCFGSQ